LRYSFLDVLDVCFFMLIKSVCSISCIITLITTKSVYTMLLSNMLQKVFFHFNCFVTLITLKVLLLNLFVFMIECYLLRDAVIKENPVLSGILQKALTPPLPPKFLERIIFGKSRYLDTPPPLIFLDRMIF
jgi:hypothetical protein